MFRPIRRALFQCHEASQQAGSRCSAIAQPLLIKDARAVDGGGRAPAQAPPALSVQDLHHHQARSEGLTQRNQRHIDELRRQESGGAWWLLLYELVGIDINIDGTWCHRVIYVLEQARFIVSCEGRNLPILITS